MKKFPFLSSRWAAVRLAALAGLSFPAPAQIAGTVIRTESVLLEIEVKVTSSDGKPVEGLTKEDFSVFENGEAQNVAIFEYVPRIEGNPGAIERGGPPSEKETPGREAPVQPHTWIYIATHAGPEERDQVRKAIREFIQEQLRPGLAVSLNGRPFVTDKTLLLAMLDGKATGPDGRSTPLDDVQSGTSYSEQFDAVDDGTMEGGQELGEPGLVDIAGERRTQTVRAALYRYIDLIRQMGALRGKKAVVLFSRGLRISPTEDDIADLLRRLSAEATRHRVSYYTVDARRLQAPIWGGDSTYSAATSGDIGPPPANLRDIQISQFGISTVAELTGGKAVINTNDLGEIFDKVEEDLSGYYVVGYYPADKTGEGRRRKIRVEVNRPRVKLSYRESYYEDLDFTHMSKSQRRRILEQVVLSETSYTDLFLETVFHFQRGGDGTPVLTYNSAIQPNLLWSLPEGGSRDLHYTFVASVRHVSGQQKPLFSGLTLKRTFTPEEWELLRTDPASLLQFPSDVKLAAGEYIWKAVVRDERTGKVGTYRSKLVVPDFLDEASPSSLLLTRQVVPRQPARPRKRGATASESAGAVPFGSKSFLLSPENAFPNGSPLFFVYDLYNVSAEQLAEPPAPRVFLIREGKVLEQAPFQGFEAEPSPERREIRYVMILDTAQLAPSEYTLVVSLPGREDAIHKGFTLFQPTSDSEDKPPLEGQALGAIPAAASRKRLQTIFLVDQVGVVGFQIAIRAELAAGPLHSDVVHAEIFRDAERQRQLALRAMTKRICTGRTGSPIDPSEPASLLESWDRATPRFHHLSLPRMRG